MDLDEIVALSPKEINNIKAVEVLQQVMQFNYVAMRELILEIRTVMETNNSTRGDLAALLTKKYFEAQEIAIKCAEKLAPYQAPKLESVEVKQINEHRFVIRAPEQMKDTQTWLAAIQAPVQEHIIKERIAKSKVIEDLEEEREHNYGSGNEPK